MAGKAKWLWLLLFSSPTSSWLYPSRRLSLQLQRVGSGWSISWWKQESTTNKHNQTMVVQLLFSISLTIFPSQGFLVDRIKYLSAITTIQTTLTKASATSQTDRLCATNWNLHILKPNKLADLIMGAVYKARKFTLEMTSSGSQWARYKAEDGRRNEAASDSSQLPDLSSIITLHSRIRLEECQNSRHINKWPSLFVVTVWQQLLLCICRAINELIEHPFLPSLDPSSYQLSPLQSHLLDILFWTVRQNK